jgi:UDP-galactose transporter B1
LAIVTTTRKFFAVLLSIMIFSHVVSPAQWLCIILVVAGSSIDFYAQLTGQERKHKLKH